MKILTATAASIALLGLFSAPLTAQDVHSAFGTRQANTQQDLLRMIVINPYTWTGSSNGTVTFKADGTGKQSSFDFTWDAKSPQQIEIFATEGGKSTTITFDNSYSSFNGTDFDGHPFHGQVEAPKATPTPKPAVAVPTPAALASNGSGTPAPASGPVAAATPTPPKASGAFFQNLQTNSGNSGAASAGDLAAGISGKEYTFDFGGWSGAVIKFNADGTASSNIKYLKNLTWKVRGTHEVEVFLTGKKGQGKYLLRFTNDMSKYSGSDPDDGDFSGHLDN